MNRDDDGSTRDPPADLQVRDLRFAYPGGRTVLDGVSFTVSPGERVAILGPNGAGKSTLLLHLNGLLMPDEGRVTVDAVPVREDTLQDVRTRVGLVFQDPDDQLFLPTLLEDVTFGPLNAGLDPHEAQHRAEDQLRTFGLLDAAHRAAHHLSGGEKRLAALATALVLEPRILALDEPTASLDAPARSRVVRSLSQRTETLLLATHDLEVVRALCHRAIVLQDGAVALDTNVPELLDDHRALRRYGLQEPLGT